MTIYPLALGIHYRQGEPILGFGLCILVLILTHGATDIM